MNNSGTLSESSDSDDSFYQNMGLGNNNDGDKNTNGELGLYNQLQQLLDDKNKENKNEEMKLKNLKDQGDKLKEQIDSMNEVLNIYKKQLAEYGIVIKETAKADKQHTKKVEDSDEGSENSDSSSHCSDEHFNEGDVTDKMPLTDGTEEKKHEHHHHHHKDNHQNVHHHRGPKEFSMSDLNMIIYNEMTDILKEYEFKANEYEEIKGSGSVEPVPNITIRACGVYKINESESKQEIKYDCQSFRVNHNSTPHNLRQSAIGFWKLLEVNFYFLTNDFKLIELNPIQINTTIDTLIKQFNGVRKPIFVISPKQLGKFYIN